MTTKQELNIMYWCIVGILVCLIIAVIFYTPSKAVGDKLTLSPTAIPTIAEIQQALVDKGYDLKIDGMYGSATKDAWDKEIRKRELETFNEYAEKYMTPTGAPKE